MGVSSVAIDSARRGIPSRQVIFARVVEGRAQPLTGAYRLTIWADGGDDDLFCVDIAERDAVRAGHRRGIERNGDLALGLAGVQPHRQVGLACRCTEGFAEWRGGTQGRRLGDTQFGIRLADDCVRKRRAREGE